MTYLANVYSKLAKYLTIKKDNFLYRYLYWFWKIETNKWQNHLQYGIFRFDAILFC